MTETTFYNSGLDIVFTLWGKVLEFIYSQLFENSRNTGRGMMVIIVLVCCFIKFTKIPIIASSPANHHLTRLGSCSERIKL